MRDQKGLEGQQSRVPPSGPEGKREVKDKILNEFTAGLKRDFIELLDITSASRSDLVAALQDLMSEGLIAGSSDGFVTIYSRR